MDVKITKKDGIKLYTAKTHLEEDLNIYLDDSIFSDEDRLITRTLTSYSNSRVTSIGSYGLAYFSSLESVELPNVTNVGSQAFRASGIKKLKLPKATTIATDICHACANLEVASLPLVKTFTQNDFYSCTKLKYVDVSSAESFLRNIFNSCYNLKAVIIRQTEKICSLGSTNVFSNCYHITGTTNSTHNPDGLADGYFYVPDVFLDGYKTATNWSTYATQIKPYSELPQEIREELGL